jgi:hypothetical protein
MIADAYSWELISYKTNSNGPKVCSNAYFIPQASLWELFLPPLTFFGSSSFIIIFNGLTPLIFPYFFPHLRFLVME